GGKDYALRYEGLVGSSWVFAGQVARHHEENSVGPATAAGDTVQFSDVDNNFFQTGGFGLIQDKTFKRQFAGGSATLFDWGHEIKLGLAHENAAAHVVATA